MLHTPPRVGLVGAGGISHAHAPGLLELGASVTVFSEHGAEELSRRYGFTVASTFDELLERSEVVDICTPTSSHLEYVGAALAAGRHVICEKPVSLDPEAAAELGRTAEARGLGLFPAHVVRWFPAYVAAQRAVSCGELGSPAVLRFSRIGEYPSWSQWFADEQHSGGIVADQMIHDLDIARWIAGEVVEVFATRVADDTAPAVSAQVLLTHENDAISAVNGIWGAAGTTFRTAFSIAGDQGMLRYDSTESGSFRLDGGKGDGGASDRPDSSFTESPYLLELREFIDAVRGGATPRVTWADGIRAVEIALAANASIATGQPVRVSEPSRKAAA
ncbi:myo-inositol 2-dehydrogenase / D-chiro-inositol 1-dehydrogenase [Jiangella alba]|uniref:Myo-inositol 2-dehydrogenase / D-chiro-inositol 1-dehydrogenase n=2 Tax=Jiangella alba TaxID=561176 RepID=A0A1H5JBP0_9ACTN|nr:myo-inositol 2-dehydrogenase / D-chiro-inositol 1-dehydrogenase [Jiangella alba]